MSVELITAIGVIVAAIVAAGITVRSHSNRKRSQIQIAKDHGINVAGNVKGGINNQNK